MNKAVSFCLYGVNNHFTDKFFKNYNIFKKHFNDYDILLYADVRLKNILEEFCINNGIIIQYHVQKSDSDGMFWRFYPILNSKYDILLIRDIDYIPSDYELDLINEFIKSKRLFHIIRSDYNHKMPIMGGLFGIKKKLFSKFKNGYYRWEQNHSPQNIRYNDDQLFLSNYIYLKVLKESLIHTKNVVFLGEKYQIINPPKNFIIGGDDRHSIDYKKNSFIYFYLPVKILKFIKYKGMKFLNIKVKINEY